MTQGSGLCEEGLSLDRLPTLQSDPACKAFSHPGSPGAGAERHLHPAEPSCHLAGTRGGAGPGHCPSCAACPACAGVSRTLGGGRRAPSFSCCQTTWLWIWLRLRRTCNKAESMPRQKMGLDVAVEDREGGGGHRKGLLLTSGDAGGG